MASILHHFDPVSSSLSNQVRAISPVASDGVGGDLQDVCGLVHREAGKEPELDHPHLACIERSEGFQGLVERDEIQYISRDFNLMAVDVNTTASTFDAGVPRTLFGLGVGELHARNNFIPSADGKRFLTSRIPPGRGYGSIAVVLDWAAVLRDR